MSTFRITQENITDILELHQDGKSNIEVGTAVGFSGVHIGRVLKCYKLHGEEVLRQNPSLSTPVERLGREINEIIEFLFCYRIPRELVSIIFLVPSSALNEAYYQRLRTGKRLATQIAKVPHTVNQEELDKLIRRYNKNKSPEDCRKEYMAQIRSQVCMEESASDDGYVTGFQISARKLPEGLKDFVPTGNKIEDTIAIFKMGGRPVDLTRILNTHQAEASRTITFLKIHGPDEYRRLPTLSEPGGYSWDCILAIVEFCLATGALPSQAARIFKTTDATLKRAIKVRQRTIAPDVRLNVAALLPGTNLIEAEKTVKMPFGESFSSLIKAYLAGRDPMPPYNRQVTTSSGTAAEAEAAAGAAEAAAAGKETATSAADCAAADAEAAAGAAEGAEADSGAAAEAGEENVTGAAEGSEAGEENVTGAAEGAAAEAEAAAGAAEGAAAEAAEETATGAAEGAAADSDAAAEACEETATSAAEGFGAGEENVTGAAEGAAAEDGKETATGTAAGAPGANAVGMVNIQATEIHCEGAGEMPLEQCKPVERTKGNATAVPKPRPKPKINISHAQAESNKQKRIIDAMKNGIEIESLSGAATPRAPEKLDLPAYMLENYGIDPGIPASDYRPVSGKKGRPQKIDVMSKGFDKLPLDVQNSQMKRYVNELLSALEGQKKIVELSELEINPYMERGDRRQLLVDAYHETVERLKVLGVKPVKGVLKRIFNFSSSELFYYDKVRPNLESNNLRMSQISDAVDEILTIYIREEGAIGPAQMQLQLSDEYGTNFSLYKVRRLMRLYGLDWLVLRSEKKYSSYLGTWALCGDLIRRDFYSDRPGIKIVTDITEFKCSNGKLYLCTFMDLWNKEILSWTISSSPSQIFVMKALNELMQYLPDDEDIIIHSDQGHHYQHESYLEFFEQRPKMHRSMSRKGNSPDNGAMESFFSILKNLLHGEMAFSQLTDVELRDKINQKIRNYNNIRALRWNSGVSPAARRAKWLNDNQWFIISGNGPAVVQTDDSTNAGSNVVASA